MHKVTLPALAVLLLTSAVSGSDAYLQYDDGSPSWLTWAGTYRGVWFNTDDFVPGMSGFLLDFTEYWFYHHSSYPWDTSEFYAEIWSGDQNTYPVSLLDSQTASAVHYSPTYVYHEPPLVITEPDWWEIVNTEMSTGGWPSTMGDASPPEVPHSYYGSGLEWVPSITDFLIRAGGDFTMSLDHATWGSIKAVFN